jgi:hypothetical protein
MKVKPWIHYAAAVWALLFAAPHTWWAMGIPAGFPGGEANHRFMMNSQWRYGFDVAVIGLCGLAIIVALAPVCRWGRAVPRWIWRFAAWCACVPLSLRGVAGGIVDGARDPVWWPTFLTGGVLFGCMAWSQRRPGFPMVGDDRMTE